MCFVCYCRDGRSRCFGFIGFREAGIAKKIVKMMNKSFIGSMRITVEQAKPVRIMFSGESKSTQWMTFVRVHCKGWLTRYYKTMEQTFSW